MTHLAVLLCTVLLASRASGHTYSTELCSRPDAVQNFNQTGILGKWRVDYAVGITSTCLEMEFRREGGDLKVSETKELAASDTVGVEMKYGSTATLTPTDTPGYYQAKYSTSKLAGRFIIMDTDYETYMVVFHCMQLSLMEKGVSRRTLYVLSRDDTNISEQRLSQVRALLPTVDIEPGLLVRVSHDQCVSAEEADIDLTGQIDLKDIIGAVRKVISLGGGITELITVLSTIG